MRRDFVFISHSEVDKLRIEPILVGLLAAGVSLWIDKDARFDGRLDAYRASGSLQCSGFGSWVANVEEALDRCVMVLGIFSRPALGSPIVRRELQTGYLQHKLGLVVIDADLLPKQLPIDYAFLERTQWR